MTDPMLLGAIVAPVMLVLGLTLLLYAKDWVKVAKSWEKDHYQLILPMVLFLALGVLMVNLYNVWAWNIWLVITLVGWGMLIKSALFLLAPGSWTKAIIKVFNAPSWYYLAGVVHTLLGGYITYLVYLA